jgi:hypothetical protein
MRGHSVSLAKLLLSQFQLIEIYFRRERELTTFSISDSQSSKILHLWLFKKSKFSLFCSHKKRNSLAVAWIWKRWQKYRMLRRNLNQGFLNTKVNIALKCRVKKYILWAENEIGYRVKFISYHIFDTQVQTLSPGYKNLTPCGKLEPSSFEWTITDSDNKISQICPKFHIWVKIQSQGT